MQGCGNAYVFVSQLVFSILFNKQKAISSSLTHIQLILAFSNTPQMYAHRQ